MTEAGSDPLKLFKNLFRKEKRDSADSRQSGAICKFLAWMETLDHSERLERVLNVGKECLSSDPAGSDYAKNLLAQLEKGDFYERHLALMSCQTSRDAERVMRFTRDESAFLRHLACNLAVLICSENEILDILDSVKLKERRRILKRLRKLRRQEIVDVFLKKLSAGESEDFKELVYFGSEDLVRSQADSLGDRMSPQDATRFAYLHPDLCLDFLSNYARSCPKEDPRLLRLVWGAGRWISELRPDRTLELFDVLLSQSPAPHLPYKTLLHLRPAQAMEMLSSRPDFAGADLSILTQRNRRMLKKIPEQLVLKAAASKNFASSIQRNFKFFSPDLRQKLFESCSEGLRNADGAIAIEILEQLGREQRIKEARKHLCLPNFATRVLDRLKYSRLLAWDELNQSLSEGLNNPDIDSRAPAFFNLVYALRFNRLHLQEVLELLHKHKNEPQPVRDEFLKALASLPPSIFSESNLEALTALIDDALKAPDLSFGSLYYFGTLLLRLFPFHRDWTTAQLCRLLRDHGANMLVSVPCTLLDADVEYLSQPLKPVIEFWEKKAMERDIIRFGGWLASRLPFAEPVIDALCNVARAASSPADSENAARHLYDFHRRKFEALVPELLKADGSWGLKRLIYNYLSRKRQSMLTPYLGKLPLPGRFSTGKTRVVPDFTNGFHRWTKKQQNIYGTELAVLAEHASSNYNDRLFGISRLCKLPEPNIQVLENLASLANKDEASRDLTIKHMASTDNGCALPTLIACLNDERARQAIYALRTAVLSMEPGLALKLLKSVPHDKITVFKETVRLAGDLASPEAFEWLRELEATDLHRDVRVALLRALWNFTEREEAWVILSRTVRGENPVFAETAIRIPTASLSSKARANLIELYKDALKSENAGTRVKTMQQIAAGPLLDPEHRLFHALGDCLLSASDNECRSAGWAIATLYAGRETDVLTKHLESLAGRPRNLRTYVQQLQVRFYRQPESFEKDARNVCLMINNKIPKAAELSLTLSATILPWMQFYEMLLSHEQAGTLHFDLMQAACQCLSQPPRASTIAELEQIEEKLRSDSSDKLRRLGLAALCGLSNSASGWTPERLQKLLSYRKDDSLMVSGAAEYTLPAAELAQQDLHQG